MDINLDDSDDEKKAPSRRGPSRVLRHAPRSSKPKPEQPQQSSAPRPPTKPETLGATAAAPKPESVNETDDVEVEESKPPVIATPKSEEAANGAVKMEIDDKQAEKEEESTQAEPMDEDREEETQEEEEEDMIVREIDVYFNPSIDPKTQLYVLQYPLRPCWRPYELDGRCEEIRVKPSNAEVEVDLSIDVETNCDKDFANKLKMTKQTLSTTWKPPHTTGYAIGILRGNELHLNPIHAVVQLRPSLDHLKAGGSKRKNNVTGDAEVTPKLEDVKEEKSTGLSKKQQKRTESKDQKAEDDESWVTLKYHGPRTEFSDKYLQRMVAKEDSPLQFTMDPCEYINSLCPGVCNNENKSKGASRRSLLSLPVEECVKKLLAEEPLFHRFSALKHFAPNDSVEDVLGVLQQHALLVQGLWTPKKCPLLTEEIKVRPLIRDYILLHFSQNTVFNLENSDIPPKLWEEAKRLLRTVAMERPSLKNWKFKANTDTSFIKLYPDIVKKQNDIWKKIEDDVKKHFGAAKTELGRKNLIPKPVVTSTNTSTKTVLDSERGAKQSGGAHIGKKMSDETREALPKALKKVFQTYKVCSLQLICQALRELAVSQASLPKADSRIYIAAAHGIDAPQQEFQEVINQIAVNIHGVYVLKSSPDNPEYDSLRKVVINLLRGKPANAKLKKTEVFSAAQIDLKRDIANNEYNKVMNDLCEFKGSAWVLKSGDGSTK